MSRHSCSDVGVRTIFTGGAIVTGRSAGAIDLQLAIGRAVLADSAEGILVRPPPFADSDKRLSRMASEFDFGSPCHRTWRDCFVANLWGKSRVSGTAILSYGHCQRFGRHISCPNSRHFLGGIAAGPTLAIEAVIHVFYSLVALSFTPYPLSETPPETTQSATAPKNAARPDPRGRSC